MSENDEGVPAEVASFAAAQMLATIRGESAAPAVARTVELGEGVPAEVASFPAAQMLATIRGESAAPAVARTVELGDVVTLASGSAPVTVTEVVPERGVGSVRLCRCMWFEAGQFGEKLIPAVALRHVEATPAMGGRQ